MPKPCTLRAALEVAFRHYDAPTTTEDERDAILTAMVKTLPPKEAEKADRILFHRRSAREQQHLLTLDFLRHE